jgi:hypothetical protein
MALEDILLIVGASVLASFLAEGELENSPSLR